MFEPLLDYCSNLSGRKLSWKRSVARALGLFYDFTRHHFHIDNTPFANRHVSTLRAFIKALQYGTISIDNTDESGLFWPPMSLSSSHEIVRGLDHFASYAATEITALPAEHPIKYLMRTFDGTVSSGTTLMQWMITARRVINKSFLAYLKDPTKVARSMARSARDNVGQIPLASGKSNPPSLPIDIALDMMDYGFVKNPSAANPFDREDITGKMVFLLVFGAGLRKSEPLHMWFNDVVFPIINNEQRCIPVLRHPSQSNTFIVNEAMNRRQYLQSIGLPPRNEATTKSYYSGWKNLPVDKSTKSTEAIFMHQAFEAIFSDYFHIYLQYRSRTMSANRGKPYLNHPFLFINSGEDRSRPMSDIGTPYSIKAFDKAFSKAVDRVAATRADPMLRGKQYGTTPHGARHAYARALLKAGVSPKIAQMCLHHRHLPSQDPYTEPSWADVSDAIEGARLKLPFTL